MPRRNQFKRARVDEARSGLPVRNVPDSIGHALRHGQGASPPPHRFFIGFIGMPMALRAFVTSRDSCYLSSFEWREKEQGRESRVRCCAILGTCDVVLSILHRFYPPLRRHLVRTSRVQQSSSSSPLRWNIRSTTYNSFGETTVTSFEAFGSERSTSSSPRRLGSRVTSDRLGETRTSLGISCGRCSRGGLSFRTGS